MLAYSNYIDRSRSIRSPEQHCRTIRLQPITFSKLAIERRRQSIPKHAELWTHHEVMLQIIYPTTVVTKGVCCNLATKKKTFSGKIYVSDSVLEALKTRGSSYFNPRPGGGLSHLRHGGGGGQNDPPPSNSKTRKSRRPGDTAIDSS